MLLVDNRSIFTRDIRNTLDGIGAEYDRFIARSRKSLDPNEHDSFILSGRHENSSAVNALNSKIVRHCAETGKKLLGICYGAEITALALGGTISRMNAAHVGKENIDVMPGPLTAGLGSTMRVFESHRYLITTLGEHLEGVAHSMFCRYEMVQHRTLPIFGTQFHPEMTEDGKRLLANFVDL